MPEENLPHVFFKFVCAFRGCVWFKAHKIPRTEILQFLKIVADFTVS